MKLEIFIMITSLNFILLAYLTAKMVWGNLQRMADCPTPEPFKFIDIKTTRPKEGAHILVWDSLEKRVIPTLYKGTHEDWEKSKDKETRFTHFVECPLPE